MHDFDDLRKKHTRKRMRLVSRLGGCAVKAHRKKDLIEDARKKTCNLSQKGTPSKKSIQNKARNHHFPATRFYAYLTQLTPGDHPSRHLLLKNTSVFIGFYFDQIAITR